MADDKALKPKSFRIDDDTAEKFKQIATTLGGNQQETLAKLIEAFEFQQGKAILTDKKADIETFESYVTALTRMYMTSLEDNQNAKELVRTEFDALLKSKDTVIQDLQEKLTVAKQLQEQATDKAKALTDENTALDNRISTLESKYDNDINNLKSMLDDKDKLNRALTDSCSDLKDKIESLQEEHQAFTDLTKELEEVNLESENLARDKINLQAELKSLESSSKRELEALKQHEKDSIERSEQQHQLAMDKALLELEKKYQDEIQILKSEKQKEIDKYQQKYFDLLEKQQEVKKASTAPKRNNSKTEK